MINELTFKHNPEIKNRLSRGERWDMENLKDTNASAPKDETSKRYGRLLVIEKVERSAESRKKRSGAQWRCKCDCGKVTLVFGNKLRNGTIRQCLTCKRA